MLSDCRWLLLLAAVCLSGCTAAGAGAGGAAAPAAPTSAAVGGTTVVAVQPAASPPCTLWQFLGVPQAAQGICKLTSCIRNQLGTLFPGLEATPAMLAISDPANLQSPNPAVSSAASVKADEDAAPQKVKAIKYLGTIGCAGCYPDVQDALLKALDDCTEEVRLAAVQALRNTACGQCKVCRTKACCSPKVMERLSKVVYDVDDQGCYKEPSPRVRRVARLAMCACGGGGAGAAAAQPLEGPEEEPPSGPAPAPAPAPATVSRRSEAAPIVRAAPPPNRVAMRSPAGMAQAANEAQARLAPQVPRPAAQPPAQPAPPQAPQPAPGTVQPRQVSIPPAVAPSAPPLAIAQDTEQAPLAGTGPSLPTPMIPTIELAQPLAQALQPPAASVAPPVQPVESKPTVMPAAVAQTIEPAATLTREAAISPPAMGAMVKPVEPRAPTTAPPVAASPAVSMNQPAADAANSPVAVATGIEPVQSGGELPAPPASTAASVEPAASAKPVAASGGQSLPIVMNRSSGPTRAGSQPQAKANGQLAIFQAPGVKQTTVIHNPFVPQPSSAPSQEIDLLTGSQAPQAPRTEPGTDAQLTNWQQDVPPANAGPAAARGPITDDQLLAYYRQNLGKYRGTDELRWDWMHVRFDSYATKADAYAAAATLRQAAVEGEIAPAMRSYPRTELRAFGWTCADQLPSPAIARALSRMRPGEVSVMMERPTGVDVVRLIEARPRHLSFEQVKEQVRRDLLSESRR